MPPDAGDNGKGETFNGIDKYHLLILEWGIAPFRCKVHHWPSIYRTPLASPEAMVILSGDLAGRTLDLISKVRNGPTAIG